MKAFTAVEMVLILGCCPLAGAAVADEQSKGKADELEKAALAAVRDKGLDWLTKNQAKDGSWGQIWQIPITSFACLSYLAASDEPFAGDRGKALERGLQYLLSKQQDGKFDDTIDDRSRWIHGQGFATLALTEAHGRTLFCKTKPDLDMKKVRETIVQAIKVIGKNQSKSGGWWYEPGFPDLHEGSTTVCAVQAIVSASNYGIEIDRTVLDKSSTTSRRHPPVSRGRQLSQLRPPGSLRPRVGRQEAGQRRQEDRQSASALSLLGGGVSLSPPERARQEMAGTRGEETRQGQGARHPRRQARPGRLSPARQEGRLRRGTLLGIVTPARPVQMSPASVPTTRGLIATPWTPARLSLLPERRQ